MMTARLGRRSLIFTRSSRPLSLGILMSERTKSKESAWKRARASSPSAAQTTS